ncbi:MAG: hypothetical protein M3454_06060 [Actinomycetota bacterium]|nr:hypothetical protein [Actinomycetota bacterium]
MTHTKATRARLKAAIVTIAPAVLLVGFVWHPYTAVPDEAMISAAVTADTTRWGLSHLTIAVGSGFTALAFLAIRSHLSEAGEQRWSALALPFTVMGSTLFAILPGMEFAALAAAETGAGIEAAQTALFPWFVPLLLTGGVTFAFGVLAFARGISDSQILSPRLTRLVVAALVVMAAARFVPLGSGSILPAGRGRYRGTVAAVIKDLESSGGACHCAAATEARLVGQPERAAQRIRIAQLGPETLPT